MARFTAPSAFDHRQPERTAVLMIQLGTPDAPEAGAVRRYLREFLSDPRVVEIPRLVWSLILNGIILNVRPARSAQKYASIWTDQGSPLMVHTVHQSRRLGEALAALGHDVDVVFAMRYGKPSIPQVMRELRERHVTRLLVLPMYPQYAGSTTATAFDEVFRELMQWRNQPELRLIRGFHSFAPYIDALAGHVEAYWAREGRPDCLLMSFHGVPKRTLMMGDPYHCECLVTARLLATRLGLSRDQYRVTFQSRFGKAEWLQPYTDATLHELGASGISRLDVVCPGFVADCLETLEEIAMEGKESFIEAGGREFRYLGCLNESEALGMALAQLAQSHAAGWPTRRLGPGESALVDQALHERKQRAIELGAER